MTQVLKIRLAVFAVLFALIYGAFAFANWQLDPSYWPLIARAFCALGLFFIAPLLAMFPFIEDFFK